MFLTFEDQYEMCQDLTGDDSAARLATFKTHINIYTGIMRHRLSRFIFEEERTVASVADQQAYQLPARTIRVNIVTYTSDTTEYYLEEITNRKHWRLLNETTSTSSNIPRYFFVDKDKVYLYPKPSVADDDITIISEERAEHMDAADYSTGTVTISNGGTSVTGAGTTWTSAMAGRYIELDGLFYKISSVTNSTTLVLTKEYAGLNLSGSTYRIGEQALGLYEDLHVVPVWYALSKYYGGIRQNRGLWREYKTLYQEGFDEAKKTYGKRSGSNLLLRQRGVQRIDPNRFPELS